MIWNNYYLSASHLSRSTVMFVFDCFQFGPSWMFGLKIELMACTDLVGGTNRKAVFFLTLYDSINDMKQFWNVCITSQLCHSNFCCWLLPICPKLNCLGWKRSLWPVATWLEIQWIKDVFLLTLYDRIIDMKNFWTVCIIAQPCTSHFCCWLLPIWP